MAEQLVSVQVTSSNRCIVPWSVVTVDPSCSFDDLLGSLKAGKYSIVSPSEFLSRAIIENVSIGKDKQSMSIVGKDMNVSDVCRSFGSFGSYVRLQVEDSQDHRGTPTNPRSQTSEKDRPSLQAQKQKKSLSYSPVKQHALNVGVVIQCGECNKWRLLFSKRKLALHERHELEQLLSDISYTCGAKIEDLQLPEQLKCVEIRTHQCIDRIEKLYYTAYPSDVLCIHCGNTENIVDSEELIYPQCNDCSNKEKVYKRGATQKKK